jgi:regulator of protease activity HflC (stomatin/prohibitin superfamily)
MEEIIRRLFSLTAWVVPVIILASIILPQAIRILREYERGVIFRLGKLLGAKGPGLILLIPVVDRMVKMDLRVVTIDVAKQEIMTRDNVPATVDAVVYFRVVDPIAAVIKVENFWKATSLIAQTTLRSVLGTTTFLPVSIDLFSPFLKGASKLWSLCFPGLALTAQSRNRMKATSR